jgi:hypothetical protein
LAAILLNQGMNSVLASGLLNVGKNIFDNLSKPSPVQFQKSNNTFTTELESATSLIDSSKPISSLRQELINDPAVQSFLSANAGNEIYLQKRADGSSQILSSSGESLILGKNSQTNQLLHTYFDKCVQEGAFLSPHRPGSVLLQEQSI